LNATTNERRNQNPRTLAYRLLGELELMAEAEEHDVGKGRYGREIAKDGDMPICYYELREHLK